MNPSSNTEQAQQRFSMPLLEWYRRVRRDLPWRRSRDPYRIWISEIMLQQTRVETVIPYYNRFMELFPTVDKLADAPEEQVLKAWEGLGYYSRARNLQTAAREIVERHGGMMPDTPEGVRGLRGIGPYTAGAVLSIAFNKPEPAVDGNVMRVLSRYFELEEDIAKPSTRIGIEKLAKSLIPEGTAGDFNQALMELGATVCTPKAAHCLPCPVMEFCGARLAGRVEELPVKAKAKPPRPERRAVALIEGTGENAGRILVRQRPEGGLLARLWELPHVQLPGIMAVEEASQPSSVRRGRPGRREPQVVELEELAAVRGRDMGELAEQLAAEDGLVVAIEEWVMDAEHIFSHIRWDMGVYRCRLATGALSGFASAGGSGPRELSGASAVTAAEPGAIYGTGEGGSGIAEGASVNPLLHSTAPRGLPPHYRWISLEDMDSYAFPNVFLRIIQACMSESR